MTPQPSNLRTDYVSLLSEAQKRVRASVLFKRFIDGTPLSNDIAVWMADLAQDALLGRGGRVREVGKKKGR